MKTRKLFLILILSLIVTSNLWSQNIFREGYIIKKNGITLEGLVRYKSNQDIPSVCTFKRFDIAREVVYSPDDISAFGYKNGNRYETRLINNKNQFLDVIVIGKIVLYRKGSEYYLDKDHQGLTEIKKGPVDYSTNGEKKQFKNLAEFLTFITEAQAGQVAADFNIKNQIIPLISAYNKESGKSYYVVNRSISEKQLSQKAFEAGVSRNRIGLLTGFDFYILNLNRAAANLNYLPKPDLETGPVIGITYERSISRRTQGLALRIDILYTEQTFYVYDERVNNQGYTVRNDVFFNFSGIKMPLLLQYSVSGHRLMPFVNAGCSYQIQLDKGYNNTEEIVNTDLHEVRTSENRDLIFLNYEVTAILGGGIRARVLNSLNLHIEGRIEMGSGLFNKSSQSLFAGEKPFKQSSLQAGLLLGITF